MQTATKNFEVIRKTDDLIYYHFSKESSYAVSKEDKKDWEETMTEYVNDFLEQAYGNIPPISVYINSRLSRTLGWFQYYLKDNGKPPYIEVSSRLVKSAILLTDTEHKECAYRALNDVLRHEAIHYALYVLDKPFSDGDDTFEKDLFVTGTSPSLCTPEHKVYKNEFSRVLCKYYAKCPVCDIVLAYETKGRYYCINRCVEAGKEHPVIFRPKNELIVGVQHQVSYGNKLFDGTYDGAIKKSYIEKIKSLDVSIDNKQYKSYTMYEDKERER
ncbi:hypothetical protein [Enterococcus phage phiSHEF13]|uniref:SprT-like domain-containing protein n=1 Tax=Enterococcus phage phiSHEF13 TaxID=2918648 RepID=A0AAE9FGI3_9CAUD|nr:hypothetical protein [Enterococcus phage phiSHEF13]